MNDDYSLQEKEAVDEDFTEVLDEIPNSHEINCGGDLNARVEKQVQSKVVGMYGKVTVKNNGERLINICQQYDLMILNGFRSQEHT